MDKSDSNIKNTRRILDLSEDERPREKALVHGLESLSSAELLAILLGSGSRGESVIDLSHRILDSCDNRLTELSKRSIKSLIKNFKGIGEAKAITLLSAIELGKRMRAEGMGRNPQITNSELAYEYIRYNVEHLTHEEFWIIFLNNSKRVIGRQRISSGGFAATVVDVRMIIKQALDVMATSMILVHNHPSGSLQPSRNDDELTNEISRAGMLMKIPVIDHLIISELGYFSYADEGKL